MRIAMVVLEIFPGSESRVQRQSLALQERGHDVRIFAAGGGGAESSTWKGIPVSRAFVKRRKAGSIARRFWEYALFEIAAAWWIFRIARSWKPDIIQIANMPDWLVFSGWPGRHLAKSRIVLDLHDPMPELMSAKRRSALMVRLLQWLERLSANYADLVIVANPPMAEPIRSRTGVRSVVVIPNAVDPALIPPRKPVFDPELPEIQLEYHGTISRRFGVEVIVKAMPILDQRGLSPRLVVCGDGDGLGALRQEVRRLGLEKRVVFTGQVASERVKEYIDSADVGIVPYLDSPFMRMVCSTKAYELAVRGCPIAMSDIPSLRDQFPGDAVTAFPPGDPEGLASAIESMVRNPERTRRQANQAYAHVLRNSWEHVKGQYVGLLESLM